MAASSRKVRLMFSIAAAVALIGSAFFPEALAFPYHRQVGDTSVYSETPISPEIVNVLARSDRLLRASPIFSSHYGHRIFLTNGGWRWKILSFPSFGAFALTRQLSEAIIVNRSDVAQDHVQNGRPIADERSLSGESPTRGRTRSFALISACLRTPNIRSGCARVIAMSSRAAGACPTRMQRV